MCVFAGMDTTPPPAPPQDDSKSEEKDGEDGFTDAVTMYTTLQYGRAAQAVDALTAAESAFRDLAKVSNCALVAVLFALCVLRFCTSVSRTGTRLGLAVRGPKHRPRAATADAGLAVLPLHGGVGVNSCPPGCGDSPGRVLGGRQHVGRPNRREGPSQVPAGQGEVVPQLFLLVSRLTSLSLSLSLCFSVSLRVQARNTLRHTLHSDPLLRVAVFTGIGRLRRQLLPLLFAPDSVQLPAHFDAASGLQGTTVVPPCSTCAPH